MFTCIIRNSDMYRSKPFSRVFFKKTLALWTTNSLIYVIKIDIESNPLKNTEFHAICKACEFALKKKSLKNFQPGFIAIPSSLYSHVHKYMIDKYVTLQPTWNFPPVRLSSIPIHLLAGVLVLPIMKTTREKSIPS